MRENQGSAVVAAVLVILVVVVAVVAYDYGAFEGLGAAPPPSGDGNGNGEQGPQGPEGPPGPPGETPETSRAPTSITAFVSPNPVNMGGFIAGTATSDGYNYAITCYAKHVGKVETQSFAGVLGSNGQYNLATQLNTPGIWNFWVVANNGVTSNTVSLTCQGIRIQAEFDHYSKTFRDSIKLEVYSHYTGARADIVAHNHAEGYSAIIYTGLTINTGGYNSRSVSLDHLANGNYEFDVIIGGDSATAWGGTYWVTVGR